MYLPIQRFKNKRYYSSLDNCRYIFNILHNRYDVLLKLKTRPFEKFRADFCTSSAFLKALKINLIYPEKKQMVKISEVRKSDRESHGLDLRV